MNPLLTLGAVIAGVSLLSRRKKNRISGFDDTFGCNRCGKETNEFYMMV
mgnify:CR=1 FL=1